MIAIRIIWRLGGLTADPRATVGVEEKRQMESHTQSTEELCRAQKGRGRAVAVSLTASLCLDAVCLLRVGSCCCPVPFMCSFFTPISHSI